MLYLAKAVSIKDLHSTVKERMPEGANITSVKWLRYQFQPLNPKANTSKYYKGNINVKMMVQKRQVRAEHVDSHYCAAAWRYLREFAVKNRHLVQLVSMDGKHKIKCGEPSFPLAAAERGKKMIVAMNQTMAVCDHDFSKCTLTPSVNLLIDIPPDINGSFYRGNVFVGIKDSIMQPSSALRHSAELAGILALGEANAGSVKEMRDKVNTPELKKQLSESLQFPVDLIKSQMVRLSLKDESFQVFDPAEDEKIDALWKLCLDVDKSLKVLHTFLFSRLIY
ncbi:Hypothetical predicted protein [Paramuricea clavata]|uniref:Uncharacterized protein n=1 Tax=Paramuricea clavata TaxID=317549 RepID=A0A6S7ILI2_PARCT|nr:Hypothetical predicted protein [Paramuricea clavata]